MKALLATAIAAILSLFGVHPAPAHTASRPPSAQVASAVSAVEDPFHSASNDTGTPTPSSTSSDSAASSPAPIIKQYITQPVIERVIQSEPFTTGRVLGASTDSTTLWFGTSAGYAQSQGDAAIMVTAIGSDGFVPDGYPVQSLNISNNFFTNTAGLAITVIAAKDAVVNSNTIVDANTVPFASGFGATYCGVNSQPEQPSGNNQPWCVAKVAAQGSIMVAHDQDVTLSNNTFLGTSQGVFVDLDSTTAITQ